MPPPLPNRAPGDAAAGASPALVAAVMSPLCRHWIAFGGVAVPQRCRRRSPTWWRRPGRVSVRASRLPDVLDTLDAAAVRRWCAGGLAALRRHQGEIDDLNVYPVPDGDTGTNLVLTLTSAQQALAMDLATLPDGGPTAHGHALRLMARGALLGARGNSGVILSQILRGLADRQQLVGEHLRHQPVPQPVTVVVTHQQPVR
ncbi:DAK2 domain-containing protein, partial [Micromonospora carbonacea]|uniref:DAK2 domain-containing protein n=1 Tax=Micromonospora carbonacea TaxID=47853 RepID=UPI003403471B